MNQININSNSNNEEEELNNNKTNLLKAIDLIDDFVTKFISKIEYYKMTLESQINQTHLKLMNKPLLPENNDKENNSISKEAEDKKNKINQNNLKNNDSNEYLKKFINCKNFNKKMLYLLYLITEEKSQIEKIIEIDKNDNDKKEEENKFKCIKEINTKNFINSISYLKNENLIALGMYNFFDGSSIDLYSLDLKIKLTIKKLGSNITELQSGELVSCSYNSINIIKLESNNNENMKYKVVQTLKGKKDSGEILGVLELGTVLISYDWNHILIWKKYFQNKNSKKKKEKYQILKFKEYKTSNYGSDYLIKINDNEFISHEKGNIIVFHSLDNFDSANRLIIKNINSIGDSMCLINNNQILLIGGNENGFLYIISVEKKELINSIKLNDISNYSINKIFFYEKDNKMNILCGGGHNLSDKEVSSDIINISFRINKEYRDIFNIEKKYIIKNAHNSWITGLLIQNNFRNIFNEKNKINSFLDDNEKQSNILKDNIIFFSTSHDKKIKIWKENNDSLI